MISVEDARRIIIESVEPLGAERHPLAQCLHRVTAEDIQSHVDIPPFDNSSMDGFALKAADSHRADSANPVTLEVVAEIAAGSISDKPLRQGTAIRVMTGAPIPAGADAVVEQEVTAPRNGSVQILSSVAEGRNIRKKGQDVKAGQIVVGKGTFLRASHLGTLASVGIDAPLVFKRPRIAFFTSGNELVNADADLEPGKIRNSNEYSLMGLIREAHCEAVALGNAADDEGVLKQSIREGLRYDALITSGGVSVGKYDLVLNVLENVGVVSKFWKVNVKPGGPFAFGVFKRNDSVIPVFSLPGNPVSTVVTFLQFVIPGLQRLMGMAQTTNRVQLRALLEHEIHKKDRKRHFSRGVLRNEGGHFFVSTTGSQSSGVLTSMTRANCLIVIPEEVENLKAGEEVEVELL